MFKLLPGLFAFFFLTTVIYAAASSIGFDKAEYLIPPGQNQQIYAQLKDASGQTVKAESTTYLYIYPGSTSARVSSVISTPSFSATAKLTIAKGTSQRSFLYQDSALGTSILVATGSGLLSGNLKITIGFPPPPPPPPVVLPPPPIITTPPPAPAPTTVNDPTVVRNNPEVEVATVVPTEPETPVTPASEASSSPNPVASSLAADGPQVLGQYDVSTATPDFNFLDQIISWLAQFISDNIGW